MANEKIFRTVAIDPTTGDTIVTADGSIPTAAYGVDYESTQRQVLVDEEIKGAVVKIEELHHLVHRKKFYSCSGIENPVDTASKYWRITTGAGEEWHVRGSVGVSGGAAQFFLKEGATVNVQGTSCTLRNHDRTGSDITDKVYEDDTFTDTGTVIYQVYMGELGGPGGSGGGVGGMASEALEWVLAPSTTYVFEVQTLENGVVVFIDLEMYDEETLSTP